MDYDNLIEKHLNSIFLPYQQKWILDDDTFCLFRKEDKMERLGITYATAYKASVIECLKNKKDIIYSGYSLNICNQFIKQSLNFLYDFVPNINFVSHLDSNLDYEFRNSSFRLKILDQGGTLKGYKLYLPYSNSITAIQHDYLNEYTRGLKNSVIIIDDLELVPSFNRQQILKNLLAYRIWEDSKIFLISRSSDEEFSRFYNLIEDEEITGSIHSINFDQAVEQGLYKLICKKNNKEWSIKKQNEFIKNVKSYYKD